MEGSAFEELGFFRALSQSGARVLLIGRRAMVVLGAPVLTADYDLWAHPDDIELLNAAVAPFDLVPNRPPHEARANGRYVLENDEHVDVLVARRQTTKEGEVVAFDEVWERRRAVLFDGAVPVVIPCIDDLILTKKWSMRAAWETPLEPEEFKGRLAEALADEEQMRANTELCRWFLRRYPTAGERLAYVRRKYAEWTRRAEGAPTKG